MRAAGLVLIALAIPGWWLDRAGFYASWLTAWWFVVGLMLGAMANLWIHRLTGGRWGRLMRPAALAATHRMPLALLLLLPLATGLSPLYPWATDPRHWADGIARPAFATSWFQPEFFALRVALYALLWWWLARPTTLARKGRTAAALAGYLLGGTLASADLLMSLVAGWYSTAFGLVVLSGQALGGAALVTLVLALRVPAALARTAPQGVPLGRDLGNLLLMWVMSWAYLAFMELLIIWSENLPHEIAWYLPRLQTGWRHLGVALVLLQFALPLLALLQRRLKDRPARLAGIAALLLVMQAVNTAWLVLPSVVPPSLRACWTAPLLALGMALLLFAAPRSRMTVTRRTALGMKAAHGTR